MESIIVSRHQAAVEFIRREAGLPEDTPVKAEVAAEDVRGKIVYGNLPLHLASAAYAVCAVEFSGTAPRGAEYTLSDMDAAGARLAYYTVNRAVAGIRLHDSGGHTPIVCDGEQCRCTEPCHLQWNCTAKAKLRGTAFDYAGEIESLEEWADVLDHSGGDERISSRCRNSVKALREDMERNPS